MRQSYSQPEHYTIETVGFGLGITIGLGGMAYEIYDYVKNSKIGLPLAGFTATFAISTFGLMRARHHHLQQLSLQKRQIEIENSPQTDLTEIASLIAELIESLNIKMEISSADLTSSGSSKLIKQLKCLKRYQADKAAELSQAEERVEQLQAQIDQLKTKVKSQKSSIKKLENRRSYTSGQPSTPAEEREERYMEQIEDLQRQVEQITEELDIEKESVEDYKIQLAYFEGRVEELNQMVEELSKVGLKSPMADASFGKISSALSTLQVHSRESSRSGSRSSSRSSSSTNSALNSPMRPSASPYLKKASNRRELFAESNTDKENSSE